MTSPLKPDEEFVMRSLATHFSATWSEGENPPDAYLTIGGETIAVEISTLTQHVVDEGGGTQSRLSDDSPALWLAKELDKDLGQLMPDGRVVVLTFRAPILKARRTKEELKGRIVSLLASNADETIDVEEDFLTNRIGIRFSAYDGPDRRKVHAAVDNQNSDAHIFSNALSILKERIETKSQKCSALALDGPLWLALFNDYFLASVDTYRRALGQPPAPCAFGKILVISGSGAVATLYEKTVG